MQMVKVAEFTKHMQALIHRKNWRVNHFIRLERDIRGVTLRDVTRSYRVARKKLVGNLI